MPGLALWNPDFSMFTSDQLMDGMIITDVVFYLV
jgi:hypothetical protein